ncbi:MAG: dihydropteroate synthase [Pyrinomonadaceae bacterium]|nr:dihydropteroate synthase [Acidobacteriota bacterium]MBK7932923.1 dihydropteroate synthase [Acidobacteriota bacterium]MBP7377009.1 dihydropteroate synthase [Pyrinomonadaceae bacterium]
MNHPVQRSSLPTVRVSAIWQTSRRQISLDRALVMAILNVTPDSFSDGGAFLAVDDALRQAEMLIGEGADIIDIGGESTRPGSERVSAEVEIERVVPVIEAIAKRFDVAVSIDTSKSHVAAAAMDAGAEIINDISGLRFDAEIADVAAQTNAGLVLMHSCGHFETMHSKPPVEDIFAEVSADLKRSVNEAKAAGVADANIVLDVGIGFGKTLEQNLELIAKLDRLVNEFAEFPILVGTSRKSFIGKILGGVPPSERLGGSIASALIAVQNGAKIVRVHDVKETVAAIMTAAAIEGEMKV